MLIFYFGSKAKLAIHEAGAMAPHVLISYHPIRSVHVLGDTHDTKSWASIDFELDANILP